MIGGYLGTLVDPQHGACTVYGGRCRSGRGRACRHLRRAAVFRADESGRRDRVDGVELRHLDATRADSDPGPAAPHLFLPGARDRRAARVLVPADKDRSSHHAGLRAWTSGSRSARALSHALRPRTARHHRQSRRGASRRHRCQDGRAACFRRRVGSRRSCRLPRARRRSADHADVRDVGDAERPDRHDDRRARLGSGRGRGRVVARRGGGAQPMVLRAPDTAISWPMWFCSRFWCCVRADCLAAPPKPPRR